MKKLTPVLLATLLLALPTTAAAESPESDGDLAVCWVPTKASPPAAECPPPKVKKKRVRKPKKKVVPPPCACDKGEKGEKGDKGDPGETGIAFIVERPVLPEHWHDDPGLELGLGWMGSAFFPANEYAWEQGPSLRLTSGLHGDRTVNVEMGWAPGRAGGYMLRATVTDWDWISSKQWLGFGGGLFYQSIGTSTDRADGDFVGILPEVSVRQAFESVTLTANLGPSLSYAFFDDARNTHEFVLGVVGSTGVTFNF